MVTESWLSGRTNMKVFFFTALVTKGNRSPYIVEVKTTEQE